MSTKPHHSEHTGAVEASGSVKSYVVGFVLSIVCTVIPYYLVVNKTITDDALLATVLGFAFIQMAIQIFFFLHLGRGPKPLYNIVFFVSTFGIVLVVVGGSIFIMNNLYRNMLPEEVIKRLAESEKIYQLDGKKTGACQAEGINHKVIIKNSVASPDHVEARLCDTLTFINEDNRSREITFGTHPEHKSYGGIYELPVRSSRPKSITLNQIGEYRFHDHLEPSVGGEFSVIE